MADRVFYLGDGELSPGEVTYIIELLAAMQSLENIQKRFLAFTNQKKSVSGSTVQAIELKYKDKIADKNKKYLDNIDGNPLAHTRVRLDIIWEVVQDARIPRPSHTVKMDEDNWEVVMKADNVTALNALKQAREEIKQKEEIEISKAKNNPTVDMKQVTSGWDYNTGMELPENEPAEENI